jgi:hypothetical protein
MKIRPVGAELFHADSHDEVKSRFSQFCGKRPNTKSSQESLSQKRLPRQNTAQFLYIILT